MRKLCWFALPCSAGILLAVLLLPSRMLAPLGLAAGGLGLAALLVRGKRGLALRLVCFGLSLGLLWTLGYQHRTVDRAGALGNHTGAGLVRVLSYPRETRYGLALDVSIEQGAGSGLRAVLYAEEKDFPAAGPQPGDRLSGLFRYYPADRIRGEETDWFYARGFYLRLSPLGGLTPEPEQPVSLRLKPALWAERLKGRIAGGFPAETAPLVTALVTGDKSGLSVGTYTALQRSGLAHAVAVSGLHVSFLSAVSIWLLGRNRRTTAVCTLVLLALFAGVAGYTPSVMRAVILQSFFLLAPVLDREGDGPTALSAALMGLLLWNPYAGAGVSLPLSFAAVAGIFCCSGSLYRRWTAGLEGNRSAWTGPVRAVCAMLATTFGALVFTVPITALVFGTVSLAAPLANLLGLWAVSLAFFAGLLGGVLGLSHPILDLPARYVLWLAERLSRHPFAAVPVESAAIRGWLIFTYALLLAGWLLRRRGVVRPAVPLAACTLALFLALASELRTGRTAALRAEVLDVGRGQSVALFSRGRSVLVDCGGDGLRNIGNVAADCLQSRGCSSLDLLVLTSFREEHSNGVEALFDRMEVRAVAVPELFWEEALRGPLADLAQREGAKLVLLPNGGEAQVGGLRLRLFRPCGAGQEASMAVLASCEGVDMLLPGDLPACGEETLAQYGDLPRTELLVAGNHGEADSTGEALLDRTRPAFAAISARDTGKYHLNRITERLRASDCSVCCTGQTGTLAFRAGEP